MKTYLLDANAVIAFLMNDNEAIAVEGVFKEAGRGEAEIAMTSLQWSEVYLSFLRKGGILEAGRAIGILDHIGLQVIPLERENGLAAAKLKHESGLAFADAVAAEAAISQQATLVTSDKDFKRVEKKVKILWA